MQVDLSNCDKEPIHIPGAIQPHGAMLVVDDDLLITRVSANIEAFLGRSPTQLLGSSISDELLGDGVTSKLRQSLESHRVDLLNPIPLRDHRFDCIVHRSGPHIIFEIEPRPEGAVPESLFAVAAQTAMSNLLALGKLQDVLDRAVCEIRRLTGFDRVMAYRFAADFHGKVVAEDKRDDWESYLTLHYPASDIPAQARRLYALNPIRLIVDVDYKPVQLVGGQGEPAIDMSHAALRSVSPIHCEYLANIGVHASMSISLMVEGKLWGLIACHHSEPLHLSFATRSRQRS